MAVLIIFWCAIFATIFFVLSTLFKGMGSALIGIENAVINAGAFAILIGFFFCITYAISDMIRFGVFYGAGKVFGELLGFILILVIAGVVIAYAGEIVLMILYMLDALFTGMSLICLSLGEFFSSIYVFFVKKIIANMERC